MVQKNDEITVNFCYIGPSSSTHGKKPVTNVKTTLCEDLISSSLSGIIDKQLANFNYNYDVDRLLIKVSDREIDVTSKEEIEKNQVIEELLKMEKTSAEMDVIVELRETKTSPINNSTPTEDDSSLHNYSENSANRLSASRRKARSHQEKHSSWKGMLTKKEVAEEQYIKKQHEDMSQIGTSNTESYSEKLADNEFRTSLLNDYQLNASNTQSNLALTVYKDSPLLKKKGNNQNPIDIAQTNMFDHTMFYNNTEPAEPTYVGLVNQAMTCYLNSLLQALFMTPEFRNALYHWEYKKSEKDSETTSIPYQLQRLFLNLQTSSKAVETTALTRSFGWDSSEAWHQHDIQELCRVMFDALEQKFKNTDQADLINRLYEGKIIDYVKCLTCNTEKSREDTFLDIPLPVRPFDTNVAYGSVEEALEAFVKYETLEGNNQYFCEKCNKKSNAHKGLKFTKFPYILTLQLKRFDFDQNTYHRIKLNDKVTFPDILNLNYFIESTSSQESPSREEDAGMSVKCDDCCTTDSSTMDEESVPNDTTILNSNHIINHEQDDDEGIDVSNGGMSSSSSSTHNHNVEKLREEYAKVKGPYIYELFSIMIHSGNASGGHYYVYIKDFRTDKWLCFNDQIVEPITHEDIQKTYGGGNKVGFYSGAYRSSTNAYMLMYRQIDPERNTHAMGVEDFPEHIKDLVEKMKENEESRSSYRELSLGCNNFKKTIYYRDPLTGSINEMTLRFNQNMTFYQVKDLAYSYHVTYNSVDSVSAFANKCRLVSYLPRYDLVDRVYQNEKMQLDSSIHNKEWLLEICAKNQPFEDYPSDPIITKVYIIDAIEKNVIDGPKYIRAYDKQTVAEYKRELLKHFNLNLKKMLLLCEEILPDKLLEDDFVLTELSSSYPYKISVTDSYEADTLENLRDSVFFNMSAHLGDIATFYIDLSDVNKDEIERLNIPTLEEYYREEKALEELAKLNMTSSIKYKSDDKYKSEDDVYEIFRKNLAPSKGLQDVLKDVQEASNSEDSSLSDSDRTLVGDAPEESELDCESSLAPTSILDNYPYFMKNTNDDDEIQKYFRVVNVKNSKLLKISMDERTTEEELKEKLEPHIKIPKDWFKIVDFTADEHTSYKTPSREDQKYTICLGRVLRSDEIKIKIYRLEMNSPEPLHRLFTTILKKDVRIGTAKQQILTHLKRIESIDIPCNKWRFVEYSDDVVGTVLNDDDKTLSLFTDGICLQKVPDEDVFSPDTQVLIYIRRWNRTEMQLEDPVEIIVNRDNFTEHLKEKVPLISNIPSEKLEFATLMVRKTYVLDKLETYDWESDVKVFDVDYNAYLLYRDCRETPRILIKNYIGEHNSSSHREVLRIPNTRTLGLLPSTSSPRREKALKIHT